MSILALDKWARAIRIISQNGGLFKSLGKLWRIDTLKVGFSAIVAEIGENGVGECVVGNEGKLMGRDCLGNAYYENKNYMISRSRWVEYNKLVRWEYEASQVAPEWFGWLHYKTDRLPTEDWAKYCLNCCGWSQVWLLPPSENLSGTTCAYYPYDTTRAKIQVWDGRSITNRNVG